MTACAAARFMAKRIHTTLGAQMRIGAGLEIVFLVVRRGLMLEIITRQTCRGRVAWTTLRAVTPWALALRAGCAVVRWACAMRGLSGVGAAGRAL